MFMFIYYFILGAINVPCVVGDPSSWINWLAIVVCWSFAARSSYLYFKHSNKKENKHE
jgi:hypothetical protein